MRRSAFISAISLSTAVAGCGGGGAASSKPAPVHASSSLDCHDTSLGFIGGLTGDNSNVATAERNGAKLAIEQFDAVHPQCQIQLAEYDDQADPTQSQALATEAIATRSVIAIIGPPFSSDTKADGPILNRAGLSMITVSATLPGLSAMGWQIFHRAVGNDNVQGPAAADFISSQLKSKRVAVIDDGSAYGQGIANIVRHRLRGAVVYSTTIDPKGTQFTTTIAGISGAGVTAVFYGGYYEAAGILDRELSAAGVHATFVGPDGVDDPGFITAAGPAADGAVLTTLGVPPSKLVGSKQFRAAYMTAFGVDISEYSAEGYDAANMLLHAVTLGHNTRTAILAYLNSGARYRGITKMLGFRSGGELAGAVTAYAYKVRRGKIVFYRPLASS